MFCCLAMRARAAKRISKRMRLLKGSIIACSPVCPERVQSARCDDFHLNPPVLFKYVAIRIKFDDALVEIVTPKALPPDWRVEPPPLSSKAVGDAWVRAARSAVLALPSVIISGELNYLLNPAHPDFKRIFIGKPRRFTFDPRLLV